MAVAPEAEALLRRSYDAFNRKDMDAVLACAHPEVDWSNALDGSRVIGVKDVKEWWERQFQVIDPQIEVLAVTEGRDGQVVVRVRQLVRFVSDGEVMADEVVQHVYTFRDGLIETLDMRDADGRPFGLPPLPSEDRVTP